MDTLHTKIIVSQKARKNIFSAIPAELETSRWFFRSLPERPESCDCLHYVQYKLLCSSRFVVGIKANFKDITFPA